MSLFSIKVRRYFAYKLVVCVLFVFFTTCKYSFELNMRLQAVMLGHPFWSFIWSKDDTHWPETALHNLGIVGIIVENDKVFAIVTKNWFIDTYPEEDASMQQILYNETAYYAGKMANDGIKLFKEVILIYFG